MGTILIVLLICVGIGIYGKWFHRYPGTFTGWFLSSALIAALPVGLLLTYLGMIFAPPTNCQTTGYNQLVALNDATTSSGRFFLGSGTIRGQLAYIYYTETDGYIEGWDIAAYRVDVVEEDRTDAVLEWYEDANQEFTAWYINTKEECSEIFRVPYGTVNRTFELGPDR